MAGRMPRAAECRPAAENKSGRADGFQCSIFGRTSAGDDVFDGRVALT